GSFKEHLRGLLPAEFLDCVTFTGHLPHDQVAEYYRRAAVCVFPSLFDNFPYTCLEAMGHGKAIVGSANGGMADMLAEGAGRLYTPPDTRDLARQVIELLADPALRERLGMTARQRALAQYAKSTALDTVEAFYRRALSERRDVKPFVSRERGPAVN
ncbi:MAG TPA: glycosyltransferase family 4 protein, partial [Trueperaceae bacterium]